jgi:glutamine amidotransferase
MIAVVDLGIGNVGSIANMLRRAGAEAVVTRDPHTIATADKLILPGVGSFDRAAERLDELCLRSALEQKVVAERTPVLGICLGMQLLTRRSEEGSAAGLGWIPGETRRFRFEAGCRLKVPHMGWNTARSLRPSVLFGEFEAEPRFYFVHSYYVACDDPEDATATCHYGHDFVCAVQRGNIAGVQFHPEKSHRFGLRLLKNFAERF